MLVDFIWSSVFYCIRFRVLRWSILFDIKKEQSYLISQVWVCLDYYHL